jgi:CrcB protein
MTVVLVGVAGGLGALARFFLDGLIRTRRALNFPYATAAINITGSLLLGIAAGLVIYDGASADWRTVLGTGFCGGYTTFSTASVETVRLAQAGRARAAIGYALGSLALTLAAGGLGLWIVWAT